MRIIRALLKPLSFLPALCMMYLIFTFSEQDGVTSSQLSYKVSYKIVETGCQLLGEEPEPWQIDSITVRFHGIIRKLAHMAEYFALAVSVAFPLYVYGLRGFLLMLAAGFVCVAFACGDEYHQSFVAGRAPSKRDVLIDSFGIFWGIIVVRIIGWTGRKTIFRPFSKERLKKKSKSHAAQGVPYTGGGYPNDAPYAQGYYPNGAPYTGGYPNGAPYAGGGYPSGSPYAGGGYPNGAPYTGGYPNDAPYAQGYYPNGAPYTGGYPNGAPYAGINDPYGAQEPEMSDRLSEDMSFKKLVQDIREQKSENRRGSRRSGSSLSSGKRENK